jgi:hypothetical protein
MPYTPFIEILTIRAIRTTATMDVNLIAGGEVISARLVTTIPSSEAVIWAYDNASLQEPSLYLQRLMKRSQFANTCGCHGSR